MGNMRDMIVRYVERYVGKCVERIGCTAGEENGKRAFTKQHEIETRRSLSWVSRELVITTCVEIFFPVLSGGKVGKFEVGLKNVRTV